MNLRGLGISSIDRMAWKLAHRFAMRGSALCSLEEIHAVAVLHLLEALAEYKPSRYKMAKHIYVVATGRVIDYVRRATGYNKHYGERPWFDYNVPTPDPSDATGDLSADDHERTMQRLPARERQVLQARLDGLYLWQIGHHLGVSNTRVYQIERAARQRYRRLAAA